MKQNPLLSDLWGKIINDPIARAALARRSHEHFFALYLPHYVKYKTAPFQKELFALTEDTSIPIVAVTAFRGSAKSTIMNMSLSLWSILGIQQAKFVLVVGQTIQQARQHLKNIKTELESNELLRQDLGPFQEEENEWQMASLVIPKYGARIMAVSIDQSVRGFRHGAHRPDLIIADDIEDLNSVQTREGRDKTYQLLTGEFLPTGDIHTRLVVVGNLLHEDCLLKRLQRDIENDDLDGAYREFALLDDDGECRWPGKYPTPADIEKQRKKIGNEASWQREFLLCIISDEDRVVFPEWIQYYDTPPAMEDVRFVGTGIDLAISMRDTADYTAMVSAYVSGYGEDMKIYIVPHVINKRMGFKQTIEEAKSLSLSLGRGEHPTQMYVEDVAYQRSAIEQLIAEGVPAEAVQLLGQDKRARLMTTSHLIQSGMILFPRRGAELLITQLTGFGKEKHDDLADAFSTLILPVLGMRQDCGHLSDLAELNNSLRRGGDNILFKQF